MASASIANPNFAQSQTRCVPGGSQQLDPAIVREFIPQVERIARKIHRGLPQHVCVEDLVQDGIVGLLDALSRGVTEDRAFTSYAGIRIMGAIYDSLRAQDGATRNLRAVQRRIRATADEIERRTGMPASAAEIAEATGMSIADVSQSVQAWTEMQLPAFEDEDECGTPIENIADDADLQPEHLAITGEQRQLIRRSLQSLSASESTVLRLYYFEEVSMPEIAERMRLTCSRVSQIHRRALQRLEPKLRALIAPPCSVRRTVSPPQVPSAPTTRMM